MAVLVPLTDDVARFAAHDPFVMADRFRVYERLRTEAPVYRFRDTVLVSRYATVSEILLDDERFASGRGHSGRELPGGLTDAELSKVDEIVDFQSRWLTAANGQRHADLRRLSTRVFSARAIADMRSRIADLTEAMLTDLSSRSVVDFISQFAYKLPLTVVSDMLDIPVELREPLHKAWLGTSPFVGGIEWRRRLPERLDSVYESYAEMTRLLHGIIASREGRPTTDLLGKLLEAQSAESAFVTEDDVVAIVSQLLVAGHQTTQDLLGNGLHSLLTQRDQWRLLCEAPELIPNAVEEVLRFRSPTQTAERIAVGDVVLDGVEIAAGSHVTCLLGAANHDQEQFPDPQRFDVTRNNAKSQLSFGRGAHFCLGAALSRLEAAIVFGSLVRRFPDVDLVTNDVEWMPSVPLLGLTSLLVDLGPDHG